MLILLVHRLGRSHLGLTWRAIRDDEVAARSAGIATPQYKSLAFGIGGFIAGVAGAFWAAQFGFVEPKIFNPNLSFQIVIIAVLGSMLRPFGAVLGSIVLVGGLELFRVASETRLLIYGVVLLLLIWFRPQGMWTLPLPFARLFRRADAGTPVVAEQSASAGLVGTLTPAGRARTGAAERTGPAERTGTDGGEETRS